MRPPTVLRPQPNPRQRRRAIAIAVVVLAVLLLGGAATFYTDVLWFKEVGYSSVFWLQLRTKFALGGAFGLIFASGLLLNLWIAKRITDPTRVFSLPDAVLDRYRGLVQPYMRLAAVGLSIGLGLLAGSGMSVQWRNWLLSRNATTFGSVDPIFSRDIGFYFFQMPFQEALFTWVFSSLVVITMVTGATHYLLGGIRPQARPADRVSPEVRAHLSVLLGAIVLVKAWGYRLDQFRLLYSPRGQVTGASYTDVNAELPALRLLVVIALICTVLFLINARQRNWVLPIGGLLLLGLTSAIAGGAYPAIIQRVRVQPNEQAREVPFIARNIEGTRAAFGLTEVESKRFDVGTALTKKQVRDNEPTVGNIRLWDPEVLEESYRQLQRIKQYYEFLDVDVDRYKIGDRLSQVMLAGREIAPADLDDAARTWVNEHLVYTHGYGVVASRADRADANGRPGFIVEDLPPVSDPGVPKVTQPRIYFGEDKFLPFAIVGTSQAELDYPQSEGNRDFAKTTYTGRGGIELSGLARRAAFAWRFRDPNVLISSTISEKSRIMFRRQVSDRVQKIAPFLKVDSDPYLVVADGRLVWVLDAYTTSDMYPYSTYVDLASETAQRQRGRANYIRNAVKFVIDAEHGTVDGYVWDEEDPMIAAWQKIFPDSFKPRAEMPPAILEHVRYPEDMFRVQSSVFATYHITNANTFYSKEDAWSVALGPGSSQLDVFPEVDPYYVLMKAPGDKDVSFMLVRPFTPNRRQNLSAYLLADSDPESYGRMMSLEFPESRAQPGPQQVRTMIQGDDVITPQLTLLQQAPSKLIYGSLQIVPIDDMVLYVQPLYVSGGQTSLPELKKVAVVVGEKVVMADTLREALDLAVGAAEPEEQTSESTVGDLLAEAIKADDAAAAALKRGDFAEYGRQDARRRELLRRAGVVSGAAPSPSPTPSR